MSASVGCAGHRALPPPMAAETTQNPNAPSGTDLALLADALERRGPAGPVDGEQREGWDRGRVDADRQRRVRPGGGQTQGGDADGWERAARGKPGECGLGSKLLVGAAGKQRDEGQTCAETPPVADGRLRLRRGWPMLVRERALLPAAAMRAAQNSRSGAGALAPPPPGPPRAPRLW